jgi:hypothetical protein
MTGNLLPVSITPSYTFTNNSLDYLFDNAPVCYVQPTLATGYFTNNLALYNQIITPTPPTRIVFPF